MRIEPAMKKSEPRIQRIDLIMSLASGKWAYHIETQVDLEHSGCDVTHGHIYDSPSLKHKDEDHTSLLVNPSAQDLSDAIRTEDTRIRIWA